MFYRHLFHLKNTDRPICIRVTGYGSDEWVYLAGNRRGICRVGKCALLQSLNHSILTYFCLPDQHLSFDAPDPIIGGIERWSGPVGDTS